MNYEGSMIFDRVKSGLVRLDKLLFKGRIKKFYYHCIKYRGKACHLTKDLSFPDHSLSNKKIRLGPSGDLLAIGGDLSSDRLIYALKNGVYPIYFDDQPILWWTSEIRCVIFPGDIHISKLMKRVINKNQFRLTVDNAFHDVVNCCSESREDFTWLTSERIAATYRMYERGVSHSVEVWQDEKLVGGLFGIALGSYFNIESMFTRVGNASKYAMIALAMRLYEMNYTIIDCGFWPTDHLVRMGAVVITRDDFLEILDQSTKKTSTINNWNSLYENWDFKLALRNHLSKKPPIISEQS